MFIEVHRILEDADGSKTNVELTEEIVKMIRKEFLNPLWVLSKELQNNCECKGE